MLVGTDHEVIRAYDINTSQCYASPIPSQHHKSSVTCLKYAPTAKVYASGSLDGSIKLWDAISGRCINTFDKAHDGYEICSVVFSRNGKVSYFSRANLEVFSNLFRFSVSPDFWQRFSGEAMGIEHKPVFDCIYWSRNYRQTRA